MLRRICVVAALAACPAPQAPPPQSKVVVVPPAPTPDAAVPDTAPVSEVPALRLPRAFVPTSYDARLAIEPGKPSFGGTIAIAGHVKDPTSVIWLHGQELRITRASATRGDPYATPAADASALTVTPHGEDLLELRADPPLAAGDWTVQLEYTGSISHTDTAGMFDENVNRATYVYSQLEATYARRVFPCIDEPDLKVPWKLALDVPAALVAVSNAPMVKETPLGDGKKRVEFAPTKPLPSYLVAFGVGPFEFVDAGKTKSGVPVRVVVLHGRTADAAWAAKTTPKILERLEDWFGMPYPYEKLDLLTIPLTVGFGAMENAGLVTYNEHVMLMDPTRAPWGRKHAWVITASHELAHQWFGDYVTMAWWDDLWLNEGFANWMETKIAAQLEPGWHDERAELDGRNGALEADSLTSARRVRQPIESPGDIVNAFDGITYDKGAAVLAMFEAHVGADAFQRGVREYIKAHAYGNATSADFTAAISAAAGHDLAPAFATFLDQAGAPELDATVACGGGARVELAQRRFVPPGSPAPEAGKPWIVPVCVAYERAGKRAEACTVLDQPKGTLALDTKACPRWLMPNVGARGYYRLKLQPSQVTALRDEAWPQLTWPERRAIAFDVFDASRRAELPLQLALSLVPKLLAGGDRFTIDDALSLPLSLDEYVPDELRGKYEAAVRALFAPGATKLGLEPKASDDLDAETVRGSLFDAAAEVGQDPELVKQAVELAGHWRDLPQAMRGSILHVAADANPELYAQLVHDVKTEPDRVRRRDIYDALGGTRDAARLKTALALLLDPAIDIREAQRLMYAHANGQTRRTAEAFVRDHFDELMKRLPKDEVIGGAALIAYVFTGACDPRRRDEAADFVTKHFTALPGGERVVKQAIEGMDQCIAIRTAIDPELRAWLGGFRLPRPKDKPKDKPKKP